MRQIKIPALQFTHWYRFEDRRNVPDCNLPGVYVFAITHKELENCPVDWSDVSYIGMTNSKDGLYGRWKQFFNSIRGLKGKHSGGRAVSRSLGNYNSWNVQLFVAAMPIQCNVKTPTVDDHIKMGWVAYLEYEAFAECCRHSNSRCKPKYNTR
jgi:hypothetical protein